VASLLIVLPTAKLFRITFLNIIASFDECRCRPICKIAKVCDFIGPWSPALSKDHFPDLTRNWMDVPKRVPMFSVSDVSSDSLGCTIFYLFQLDYSRKPVGPLYKWRTCFFEQLFYGQREAVQILKDENREILEIIHRFNYFYTEPLSDVDLTSDSEVSIHYHSNCSFCVSQTFSEL
jgi:hypothetical protein